MHFAKSIIGFAAVFGLPSAFGYQELKICQNLVRNDVMYPDAYCGTSLSPKPGEKVWAFRIPQRNSYWGPEYCTDTQTRWCCKIDATLLAHYQEGVNTKDSEVTSKCIQP
ncbi:hypothetical protein PTTG_28279 [Puccinia triticina 1-1 BBBD Race 1]|uniref:Secreted protein n=2 Tax=Puccinia triticina TaxID=208348 RepID=A0A180GDE0_PUCT1|nr:uncharacterized protein PtA15_11A359 [Puccinia triticina]OAV90549.1 hypothetical protein PTTG_28279 [Puccinia triticina 1-1 BBBD Race 1]WAQ89668.1 hypothetical protein PtA15_11A359 [Puccinia triticina]WAR59702.1 hypothetical protein PtB15_11B342 [Puccinia triticina]